MWISEGMYVCVTFVQIHIEARRLYKSPGTRVIDNCKPLTTLDHMTFTDLCLVYFT